MNTNMTGEIQFMRKQIFGGFNRKDAVAYVAKIAKERNEARDANEEALKKIDSLKAEINELKTKLEEAPKSPVETSKVKMKPSVKARQNEMPKVTIPKAMKTKIKPRVQ